MKSTSPLGFEFPSLKSHASSKYLKSLIPNLSACISLIFIAKGVNVFNTFSLYLATSS